MSDKFYTFTSPEGKTRKIPALAFKAAAVLAVAALPRLAAGICRLPRA